ncbi:MAG: DUF6305 family protein [Candidatus Aminicenantes bacterium]
MKKIISGRFVFIITAVIMITCFHPVSAQENPPEAELPVLTTSAGQSPDVMTLNIVCEEAGIMYDYCDVPDVGLIKAGVGLAGKESDEGFHVEVHTDFDKYPEGTPYNTIIFAIGASLKGMGASGLTVNDEVTRLKNIVDYSRDNDIFIIGVHIGGVSKRGAPGSDNERMIDAVAPYADYLVVTKDSNKDSRFTEISEEKGIPLTEIDYALHLVDILKQVFKVE